MRGTLKFEGRSCERENRVVHAGAMEARTICRDKWTAREAGASAAMCSNDFGATVSQYAIYNDEGDGTDGGSKATLVNLFAPGAPSRVNVLFPRF